MIANIISNIIVHKAAIMLGAAAVGVVSSAVVATKDRDKYVDNVYDEVASLEDDELTDEAIEILSDDDVNVLPYDTVIKVYKECVPKKRKAIIFLKSYWRTCLILLLTLALMIFSHVSMAKELAATAAALGIATTKYEELRDTLKEQHPEIYEKVQNYINEKHINEKLTDGDIHKEESYDGRQRYYEPWSCQIFYATDAQMAEAERAINKKIYGGGASLFDYLASFPSSSGIKLDHWMKHFGWFTGSAEETTYEYNSSHVGPYIEPIIKEKTINFHGDKMKCKTIDWDNFPDLEPDRSPIENRRVERALKKANADRKKVMTA